MLAPLTARRMLLVLLPGVVIAAGCNDVLNVVLNSDSELPVKNEQGLTALGTQFGQAVQKGDFAAAYALGSSQLKARRTEERFVADLKNDWQLHAEGVKPQDYRVSPWMIAEEEFKDWADIPTDIKYAQLEGIVTVRFALQVEDGEFASSVSTDLLVVQEGGQLRIAHVCELMSPD